LGEEGYHGVEKWLISPFLANSTLASYYFDYMRHLEAERQEKIWKMDTKTDRARKLERQIEELKSRWPAHSVPPAMFQQLEELEEELERELKKVNRGATDAQADSHD